MQFDLNDIQNFITVLEKRNDQSISFEFHGDGSGAFVDFWDQNRIISFDTVQELEDILKAE